MRTVVLPARAQSPHTINAHDVVALSEEKNTLVGGIANHAPLIFGVDRKGAQCKFTHALSRPNRRRSGRGVDGRKSSRGRRALHGSDDGAQRVELHRQVLETSLGVGVQVLWNRDLRRRSARRRTVANARNFLLRHGKPRLAPTRGCGRGGNITLAPTRGCGRGGNITLAPSGGRGEVCGAVGLKRSRSGGESLLDLGRSGTVRG